MPICSDATDDAVGGGGAGEGVSAPAKGVLGRDIVDGEELRIFADDFRDRLGRGEPVLPPPPPPPLLFWDEARSEVTDAFFWREELLLSSLRDPELGVLRGAGVR